MSTLILARHHESEWNKIGQWTGIRDRHLTEYGFRKSVEMGDLIRGIRIDAAFASMQVRSIETLSCMLETLELVRVPTVHAAALNERDYGDFTGKNKWEMQKLIGEHQWTCVRRDWDCPVPGGETLKMVYERAVSFFRKEIVPLLNAGNNVLVVAHGNSLRSIVKYIEGISDEGIAAVEVPFGMVMLYELDAEGRLLSKEVRQAESAVPA
jgi:2,3-bisphosphoglycerate-dependent phosphoglycerate mutase